MSQGQDGMVDVHAEVVGTVEMIKRRRIMHKMWAWRKTIGVLVIVIGLVWLGQDMFTNPNSNIVPVVNQAVDKTMEKMSGPSSAELSRIQQSAYQYGIAIQSGTETKLNSMWRNMFRSDSYVKAESLQAAITAVDGLRVEEEVKSPEAQKEIDRVIKIFQAELGIIQAGKKIAVAATK